MHPSVATNRSMTDPRHPRSHRNRGFALVVGLLLAVVGAAGLATPASASAPGAPRPIVTVGFKTSLRVYWAPPANGGGKTITSYKVQRSFVSTDKADATFTVPDSAVLYDRSAQDGVGYRYRIMAINADGAGPWSPWIDARKVSDRTDYDKFGTRDKFVVRQYQDLLGRAATPTELATGVAVLTDGSKSPAAFIDDLVLQPDRALRRQPVIRLYAAYFRRGPDHGGLEYWAAQRGSGAKTLDDTSSAFAASSEFRATYGSLSDTSFVQLVYRNVLGREPEAGGYGFWTRALATRASTRGRMMTQFSESSEFMRVSRGIVLAADVHDAMLGKAISNQARTLWGAHIQGGGTAGGYGTYIMTFDDYRSGR